MGMTAIEKILARAAVDRDVVRPGDLVVVRVDTAVLYDNNFTPGLWRDVLKVHDPDRVVVVMDHRVPSMDINSATGWKTAREFVERFGIERHHLFGENQGISHVVVAENGYALPGTVLVCGDSHTCSAGAFNCAARGTGYPDMVYAVTKGETWFRVGETVRYEFTGAMPANVSTKDVFLFLADHYGEHAGMNVEFGGPGIASLSINARRTLTTMGAELSAEFATFEPDEAMLDYVRARNDAPFEAQYPDADADYADIRTVDLAAMEPLVALPDAVLNNAKPAGAVTGVRLDQCFVGSCANGTIEDIATVAQVLKGRKVAKGTRFLVTPGSQRIYLEAVKAGYVETILEAGAVFTPATCGACSGAHMGVLGPDETCITASTRNFKGRMGDNSAKIYMGSPATVAASAVAGEISDPTPFLK
jgi:3-isopropylmalate/(R)-2-methylmalate dehydratase large subunit